jgi:hypothetical protein
MSDIFAPKEIPVIKTSGLVLAMVLCASLLSACDCDGDCKTATVDVTPVAVVPATPTPVPVTPTPAPVTPVAAKCADARFCKYDATGTMLDDSAKTWSCVQDKLEGHFWEVKTDDYGLRDKDWTYAKTGTAGSCGGSLAVCSPTAYVTAVNTATVHPCGTTHTCRLPTHPELIYLSFPAAFFPTAGKTTPTTTGYTPPAAFFPDVVADGFYFNSTDDRQVAYGVSIPAGSSIDAISLLGMAPISEPAVAGHIRLICD